MSRRPVTMSVSSFGRRDSFVHGDVPPATMNLSDDVRLFALTFTGGFLFMAVYLA